MNTQLLIDNHVHIGVDPLFYLRGRSPYALDIERLLVEAGGLGIQEWVVFPFVSYVGLNLSALREGRIEADRGEVPYQFENSRLAREIARLDDNERKKFRQFFMADPGRQPEDQVGEWESLEKEFRFHGIKIQPTMIQSPILSLLAEGSCMLDFAADRGLPFLIHSSIDPDDAWSQCADILRVAEARADVRFVLAHSCRFHKPSLDRVAAMSNVWFDCSAHGIHCECAVRDLPVVARREDRFPTDYSSPGTVLRDLASAYPEKLIWGSDAPFYSYSDESIQLRSTYRREVAALDALPPAHRQAAARDNTLRWLGEPA